MEGNVGAGADARKPSALRDALVALSLSNLVFLASWIRVLARGEGGNLYMAKYPLNWRIFIGAQAAVLLLALALFAGGRLVRRSGRPWLTDIARVGLVLSLLVPLNVVRVHTGISMADLVGAPVWLALPLLALGVAVAALVARDLARSARLARAAILVALPFLLVTFGRSTWTMIRYGGSDPAAFRDEPVAGEAGGTAASRLVWLVFDEMDERLTFGERPASLDMPAFDRLRAESVAATRARAPDRWTQQAVPELLTGRDWAGVRISGPDRLLLEPVEEGGRPVPWHRQPTIFDAVRERGWDAGLVGWYHPYCRLFADVLTRCDWQPYVDRDLGVSLSEAVAEFVSVTVGTLPGAQRVAGAMGIELLNLESQLDELDPHWQLEIYRSTLASAVEMTTDPTLDFVYIHLPIPHRPVIYDRETATLRPAEGVEDYFDNLALADRTLGQIRGAMETAGLWDGTAVLVTADHNNRKRRRTIRGLPIPGNDAPVPGTGEDNLVPFLLKLPGQDEQVIIEKPFSLLVLGDLSLAVLGGRFETPADVAGYLVEASSPVGGRRSRIGDRGAAAGARFE